MEFDNIIDSVTKDFLDNVNTIDKNTSSYLTDAWPTTSDDLLDTIFSIDNGFFNELSFDDLKSTCNDNCGDNNILSSGNYCMQEINNDPVRITQSPALLVSDSTNQSNDFHGFSQSSIDTTACTTFSVTETDGLIQNECDTKITEMKSVMSISMIPSECSKAAEENVNVNSSDYLFTDDPMNQCIDEYGDYIKMEPNNQSCSSSDSGLSSDNLDMDVSPDYEPLSPALSSPGPSISERGGQNSPPRYIQQINVSNSNEIISTEICELRQSTTTKPKVVQQKIAKKFVTVQKKPGLTMKKLSPQSWSELKKAQPLKLYKIASTGKVPSTTRNNKLSVQVKNAMNTSGNSTVARTESGEIILNCNNGSGIKKLMRVNPNTVSTATKITPVKIATDVSQPRSIFVPIKFPDTTSKDVRTIKIINASNLSKLGTNLKLSATNLIQKSKQNFVPKKVIIPREQFIDETFSEHETSDTESTVYEDIMIQSNSIITAANSINDHNSDSSSESQNEETRPIKDRSGSYPKLLLTIEEKRLLAKDGISLPGQYPLTKHEERELKRIRRKIRNKISAQDSRKRKKEYVDGLEERVKQCTDENQTLMKRIKVLQNQNQNLMGQMKKLQALLTRGTGKTAQPATCLMVLLLSLALVAVPNLKLGQNSKEAELAESLQESLLQNRRNLLFDSTASSANNDIGGVMLEDEISIDESIVFNNQLNNEHDYADVVVANGKCASFKKKFSGVLVDFDVDDKIWKPPFQCVKEEEIFTSDRDDLNDFNKKASEYYEQFSKNSQTSGFNIDDDSMLIDPTLDRDHIFEMIAEKTNAMLDFSGLHHKSVVEKRTDTFNNTKTTITSTQRNINIIGV